MNAFDRRTRLFAPPPPPRPPRPTLGVRRPSRASSSDTPVSLTPVSYTPVSVPPVVIRPAASDMATMPTAIVATRRPPGSRARALTTALAAFVIFLGGGAVTVAAERAIPARAAPAIVEPAPPPLPAPAPPAADVPPPVAPLLPPVITVPTTTFAPVAPVVPVVRAKAKRPVSTPPLVDSSDPDALFAERK